MVNPSITGNARPVQAGPLEGSTELEPWIARVTWAIWPAMNWIVPAFVCLHGLLGNGGWESLVLIPASVVVVPVTALLGALPRYLLRKGGHLSTPLPIVPLLFVTWWGWICFGGAMTGATDSAPLPSIFNALAGGGLPSLIETVLMLGGAGTASLAWIAVLIIAKVRAGKRPQNPRSASVVVAWASAFLIPAILIVTCLGGARLGESAVDAGGDTFSSAEARNRDSRNELDRQRLKATQQALSQVRALISPGGWTGAEVRPKSSNQCPWDTALTDCYSWRTSFVLKATGPLDFQVLKSKIEVMEWDVQDATTDEWGAMQLGTHSPDGTSIAIRYSQGASGEYFVNTTATSPGWWGSRFDVRLNVNDLDAKAIYAADDYPPF